MEPQLANGNGRKNNSNRDGNSTGNGISQEMETQMEMGVQMEMETQIAMEPEIEMETQMVMEPQMELKLATTGQLDLREGSKVQSARSVVRGCSNMSTCLTRGWVAGGLGVWLVDTLSGWCGCLLS